LGCGLGARPILNTDVFCVADPTYSKELLERILHPRRILDGVRLGVEHGGNKSGIPTVNGALVFDDRYLGKPLIYCGTAGVMPRTIAGRPCEEKKIDAGDLICMVGGRIGKDGIHGATFSSLALDKSSPVTAVQLGDPITQKRAADFLLEARDLGLYRCVTDNGAGGLSSSVGELAELSGGARMDVAEAKVKYPGLKPFELVVSESQERMTLAVPPEKRAELEELANRRGVELSFLGEFTTSGHFEILHGEEVVGLLDLTFLHDGNPTLQLQAEWTDRVADVRFERKAFSKPAEEALIALLGRLNIASKEWLIRQYDHEVQGSSVIKPLHTVSPGTPDEKSGPNDSGVVRLRSESPVGVVVGSGLCPRLSDHDPYTMAQMAVDEAARNVIASGAEYGEEESVLAMIDNFCWPDPVSDPFQAGALVRACFGMQKACLELGVPLISGKDSMKNNYRGHLGDKEVHIAVPPTLLMTALGRTGDIRKTTSSDFKTADDQIYLLGPQQFGWLGSEFGLWASESDQALPFSLEEQAASLPRADWEIARKIYSWLGKKEKSEIRDSIRSIHDLSDGGLGVALGECVMARGLGATIDLPADQDPWKFFFGETFHSFVVTIDKIRAPMAEEEWRTAGVPFLKLGEVTRDGALSVRWKDEALSLPSKDLFQAWTKEGFWG
jgi:phosphoribosylformylglycinamidine synthase II